MSKPAIDTTRLDALFRERVIDSVGRRVLVSRLTDTEQEKDLSSPTNCGGFGRIRHFKRAVAGGWPDNPLPIVPAAKWLGIEPPAVMEAEVFQIAACAWRCWYCFVPYASMRADRRRSSWWSADTLVDAYLALPDRPAVIDLSGGSPDLAPEWIAWVLDAVAARDGSSTTYVWSDDNLSSDRLVRRENRALLHRIGSAPNYGKACCLKGYDAASFAFNTGARAEGFEEQLRILASYASTDLDIYIYLPLVGPAADDAKNALARLVDRLAAIRHDLPLRTVPLLVTKFGAMVARLHEEEERAMTRQWELVAHWPPHQRTHRASDMTTLDALRKHVAAISRETVDFASLCEACEGAWPKVVADILGERPNDAHAMRILAGIATPAQRAPTLDRRLPPPHPLDADWRFTPESAETILEVLLEAAGPAGTILLVCMPTVALAARDRGLQSRIAIASRRDDPVDVRLRAAISDVRWIALDGPQTARFAAIGIDPPWYDDIALPLVSRCIDLTATNGTLYLCVPDRFTFPSDAAQIASVVKSAAAMELASARPVGRIRYETPFFELHALGALGINNVSPRWRTGILMACVPAPSGPRHLLPTPVASSTWRETVHGETRVWFRSRSSTDRVIDTWIGVSTSISRRDPMRNLADLWTSGNTIAVGIGPLDDVTLAQALIAPVAGHWSGDLADALDAEKLASDRSIVGR